jgi:hypothetical protein
VSNARNCSRREAREMGNVHQGFNNGRGTILLLGEPLFGSAKVI